MRLDGWKQIAFHLKVSERTAQKWARTKQMPVYHSPGKKGRAFADHFELDRWRLEGETPEAGRSARRRAVTVRLPNDCYKRLALWSDNSLRSMQELVADAVGRYLAEQRSTIS